MPDDATAPSDVDGAVSCARDPAHRGRNRHNPGMRPRSSHLMSAVLAVALLGFGTMSIHAADRPVSLDDLLRLQTIREVDLDPDGRRAVITIESFVPKAGLDGPPGKGDVATRRHLHLLDLDDPDAVPRPLTFGDRSDSAPVFSPDGNAIAFVRKGPEDEDAADAAGDAGPKSQVWVLPLDGGEARAVTDLEHGASRPRWSPDGRSIVVQSRVPIETLVATDGSPPWPVTRPGRGGHDAAASADESATPAGDLAAIRRWLAANEAASTPQLVDRPGFLGERKVEERLRLRQVFVVPIGSADEPPMEPVRLGRGIVERWGAAFMPDGESVVLVSAMPGVHPDENRESSLDFVELEDPTTTRTLFGEAGRSVSEPLPGPDGTLIAFSSQLIDEPNYRGRALGLVPATGGEPIWATNPAWRSVDEFRWSRSAGRLIFTAGSDGAIPFFTASPATIEPVETHRLREGLPAQVHAFDVAGGTTAWVESSAGNPSVLRVERDDTERLAFDANPWIAARRIVRPTEHTHTRPDGTVVRSWLLPPLDLEPGSRHPLLLAIHGGPMSMWGPAEPTMWLEWQLAAAWGFGVVYANPRGSGGSGEAFQRGNHRNWGEGPAGDCLAAVDAACESPWVDPDRLVVTGGSYGGYLTAWIIAHDHRFKAAVAQRGVYDLATFHGEGNAFRLVEWAFGATPTDAESLAVLDEHSPYRVAGDIRTPLLIIHGDRDLRTGVSQSAMLYRALRELDRPVEYALYPGADHDLSRSGDPVLRMDRLARILDFFARHVEVPGPTEASDPAWSADAGD